jgi:glucan-binding YG repeat protein
MCRDLLSKSKYGGLLVIALVVVMVFAMAPVAVYGVEPQENAEGTQQSLEETTESAEAAAVPEPQEGLVIDDTEVLPLVAAGERFEDGYWYFYDAAGNRVIGWVDLPDGRHVFYTNESGMSRGGMYQVGDAWYYFGTDGNMYANCEVGVNGYWYYFGADGKRAQTWTDLPDGRRIFYTNATGMLRGGMYQIEGAWYYFGTNGDMYKNREVGVSGYWYYFGADGKRAQAWTDLPDGRRIFYTNATGMLRGGM